MLEAENCAYMLIVFIVAEDNIVGELVNEAVKAKNVAGMVCFNFLCTLLPCP